MTAEPIAPANGKRKDTRISAAERRRRICEGGPPTPWEAAREDRDYYSDLYDQEGGG